MKGEAPRAGVRLGTVRDGVLEHEAGRDVTLSAPKSVSLAALVDGDRRVARAHDEAVRATLDWIEEELLLTRQWDRERRRHRRVRSPSLVAAVFRHLANRNLDPQLHSHAVVANMTLAPGGEWRSLDLGPLTSNEMLIGAFYRNELAARLVELGLRPGAFAGGPRAELRDTRLRAPDAAELLDAPAGDPGVGGETRGGEHGVAAPAGGAGDAQAQGRARTARR